MVIYNAPYHSNNSQKEPTSMLNATTIATSDTPVRAPSTYSSHSPLPLLPPLGSHEANPPSNRKQRRAQQHKSSTIQSNKKLQPDARASLPRHQRHIHHSSTTPTTPRLVDGITNSLVEGAQALYNGAVNLFSTLFSTNTEVSSNDCETFTTPIEAQKIDLPCVTIADTIASDSAIVVSGGQYYQGDSLTVQNTSVTNSALSSVAATNAISIADSELVDSQVTAELSNAVNINRVKATNTTLVGKCYIKNSLFSGPIKIHNGQLAAAAGNIFSNVSFTTDASSFTVLGATASYRNGDTSLIDCIPTQTFSEQQVAKYVEFLGMLLAANGSECIQIDPQNEQHRALVYQYFGGYVNLSGVVFNPNILLNNAQINDPAVLILISIGLIVCVFFIASVLCSCICKSASEADATRQGYRPTEADTTWQRYRATAADATRQGYRPTEASRLMDDTNTSTGNIARNLVLHSALVHHHNSHGGAGHHNHHDHHGHQF